MPDHRSCGAGRGEAEARLGIYGDTDTIPGQRPEDRPGRRTRRWLLKRLQRGLTESVSSALCGYASGPVTIDISEQFVAHVCGITHCGSPWCCPICSPVIRERVAAEYNELAAIAHSLGWTMVFVVGTLRHHLGDRLADMLPLVTSACHESLKGRWWDNFKREHHYAGMLRTIEIDYGWVNGWHPHFQALLFFRGPVGDEDILSLGQWWHRRWDGIATRAGYGPLVAEGLVAERLRDEDKIGDYMVKPAGSWGIGREMARGDIKRHGELSPAFDLLALETMGLWCEYERATRGRHFRKVSKSLRAELLGSRPDLTDEQLAAAEGLTGRVLFRVEVGALWWDQVVDMELVGSFLQNLECVAALLAFMATSAGHEVPALEYSVAEVDAGVKAQRLQDSKELWIRGQRKVVAMRQEVEVDA